MSFTELHRDPLAEDLSDTAVRFNRTRTKDQLLRCMERVISFGYRASQICLKEMLARQLVSIQVGSAMLLKPLSQIPILSPHFGLEARQEDFVYNILWNLKGRAYSCLSRLNLSFDTPFLVNA
ncbi:uncharacterized protein ARMOST_16071 [Armillaria ostoyae]|uniref:Uncharacterized protein n=1 Tax=Armillaria ostoyae TaxID=47428 RepID=A0A284RV66_ARMOS|nr:uncharacterized protein ARMOST_16071 [Armillaria ostoyae]